MIDFVIQLSSGFQNPLSHAIGCALVHFVWQGILFALVVKAILSIVDKSNSNLRYLIGCCGLCLMAVAPIVTSIVVFDSQVNNSNGNEVTSSFSSDLDSKQAEPSSASLASNNLKIENENPDASPSVSNLNVLANSQLNQANSQSSQIEDQSGFSFSIWSSELWNSIGERVSVITPHLFVVWLIGCLILLARLLFGCLQVRSLKSNSLEAKDARLQNAFQRIFERLEIRQTVVLRFSSSVMSPIVVGFIKPMILLPPSIMTGLSTDQVEAILSHELAHVRRADFLVNLLQSLLEVFLFFHPAVWWVSRQVRVEREHCCDDLATKFCEDNRTYAEALIQLAQVTNPSLAVSASGGDLLERVRRLCAYEDRRCLKNWFPALFASGIFALLVLSLFIGQDVVGNEVTEANPEPPALVQEQDPNPFDGTVIKIVDADGKPVKDVRVHAGVWQTRYIEDTTFPPNSIYHSDVSGIARVKLPETYNIVRLWFSADGYVPMFANWERAETKQGKTVPTSLTVTLTKGVTIGGQVVDEEGKPVAGAKVTISAAVKPVVSGRVRRLGSLGLVKTDKDGLWTINNAPPEKEGTVSVTPEHTGFLPGKVTSLSLADAKKKLAKSVLSKGIELRGTVLDDNGFAVEKGIVVWGDQPYLTSGSQEVMIADDGTFKTAPLTNGQTRITVIVPGLAPHTEMVDVSSNSKKMLIRLKAGNKLRIKLTDQDGNPIRKGYVQVESWRGASSIYAHRHPNVLPTEIPVEADKDGNFEWTWAPEDEVEFSIHARGFVSKRDVGLRAKPEVQTIKLSALRSITGQVVDGATGKAIANCDVLPLVLLRPDKRPDQSIPRRQQLVKTDSQGKFSIQLDREDCGYRLGIEAKGYSAGKTEIFRVGKLPKPFNVKLTKSEPFVRTFVDTDGKPINGLTVAVATQSEKLLLDGMGGLRFPDFKGFKTYETDEQGRVDIPKINESHIVVAMSGDGYCEKYSEIGNDLKIFEVKKWCTVEGVFPHYPDATRSTFLDLTGEVPDRLTYLQTFMLKKITNEDGSFLLDRIPAIRAKLEILIRKKEADPRSQPDRYSIPIDLASGEKRNVDFSKATKVFGNVELDPASSSKIDLSASRISLRRIEPTLSILDSLKQYKIGAADYKQTMQDLDESGDFWTKEIINACFERYGAAIGADGKFQVEILTPGQYQLELNLTAKKNKDTGNLTGVHAGYTSKLIEVKGESVQLGKIEMSAFKSPERGEQVQNFKFKVGEQESSLSDLKGQYVLIDVWAEWGQRTGADNAKLEKLLERCKNSDKFTTLSVAANGSGPNKRNYPEGVKVIEGKVVQRNQTFRDLGIWTLPHYILVDPDRNLVLSGSVDELKSALDQIKF